ncbi:MAG: YihA family ribosome biogenesis GTP-binding protein [Bacteroidales bacterium]|nr:YihA family ribosome biogenesis GTP-binding protein [Bacteroidales bacterium]
MEIKHAKYVISNSDPMKCPATDAPEYAFIGRSNVGKSSLINMLTRHRGLAKTSQKPGKTLLINHFSVNDGEWWIVDLPGYGYAARGKDQRLQFRKMIERYVLERQQMTCLFVLIDIRHEPQKVDVEFLTWLGEHQVPFAIVFTKADKLGKVKGEQMVSSYKRFLLKDWEELPPLFVTSAEKGEGRDALIDFISKTNLSIKEAEASGVAPEEAIEEEKRNEISDERMDSSSEEDTTRQIEGEI